LEAIPVAFDIYVGPLTRYYTGDWENRGQQAARENGLAYQVVRPGDSEEAISDPERIRTAVCDWREALTEALGDHLEGPLEWPESSVLPYFTDRPSWTGYGALLLLAAYEEHPELDPPSVFPENWREDRALAMSREDDLANSDYPALLVPELWLPCPFNFMFKFLDPAGNDLYIASLFTLRDQLELLNERTFRFGPDDLMEWRQGPPAPEGAPFNEAARFGLGVFLHLAAEAVANRMPMKLDY